MIQIKNIGIYRDGGSPGITLRNVDPLILESLKLPDLYKQKSGDGDTCNIYEVWRDHTRGKDHGKYFFGDINGKNIELKKDHPLIVRVFELLKEERLIRVSAIDRFIGI